MYCKFLPIISFFILSFQSGISQSFVVKDSSEIIPFSARLYFQNSLDSFSKLEDKIINHRILTKPHDKFQDGILVGNFGSQSIPILHENRFFHTINLGFNHASSYQFTEDNIPYYILNKPLSEIDFILFGNSSEEFKGHIHQNLSKKLYIGAGYRRSNNKGYFSTQQNLHNSGFFHATYQSDKYRSNIEFIYNDMKIAGNGGYQFSVYDSLQPSRWINAQPRLDNALSEFKNYRISWRNRILIAPVNRLVSNNFDSMILKPIHSNLFLDINTSYGSERVLYSDPFKTNDRSYYGIYASDTNFNKIVSKILNYKLENKTTLTYHLPNKLKIAGYSWISNNAISQNGGLGTNDIDGSNLIAGIGGKIEVSLPYNIYVKGEVYKSLLGYTNKDILVQGELQKSLGTGNLLTFSTKYSEQLPAYFYSHPFSNGFQNVYQLKTVSTFENKMSLSSSRLKINLDAQYFLIKDFLTFDTSVKPIQVNNNFIQLYAQTDWYWKIFYFPTKVYFQNSIFPRTILKQTLAYRNSHFKDKLNVILGFDVLLNFNLPSMPYHAYLMQNLYDANASDSKLFPKIDLFTTLKISKVNLSFVWDNFFSNPFSSGTDYNQYYPITPNTFYFRMTWQFME